MAKDRGNKSDPFVSFALDDRALKTSVVKADLNPEWNETFAANGTLGSFLEKPILFKVWDWDSLSRNDYLGELSVTLEPLLSSNEYELRDEPLQGATTGTICILFVWRTDVELALERAALESYESAKAETVSSIYLNIALLNAKDVAIERLREASGAANRKLSTPTSSAKAAVAVKANEGTLTAMVAKMAETICVETLAKLDDAFGIVASAEHSLSLSPLTADGIHLIVICVKFHKARLDVLLKDECNSQIIGILKCLGLQAAIGRSRIRKATPEVASALESELQSRMLDAAGLRTLVSTRTPADQWLTYQQTATVHNLPGTPVNTQLSRPYLVAAGLPEHLVATNITNKGFVQRIGGVVPRVVPPRTSVGADTENEATPAKKITRAAQKAIVSCLTGASPAVGLAIKLAERALNQARLRAVAAAGRLLRVTAVRADNLKMPISMYSAPYMKITLIMPGCEPSSLSRLDPYSASTPPKLGGVLSSDQNAEAEVVSTSVSFDPDTSAMVAFPLSLSDPMRPPTAAHAAALLVEVRHAPPFFSGGGDVLLGSAILKLDKLATKAVKLKGEQVSLEASLALFREDEGSAEKAKPTGGVLRLLLDLGAEETEEEEEEVGVSGGAAAAEQKRMEDE